MKNRIIGIYAFRTLLVTSLLVISYLAFVPKEYPPALSVSDKLNHVAAFLALAFLTDFSFPKIRNILRKTWPLLVYGVGIEIVQIFLPFRHFSLLDVLADAAGLLVYSLCSYIYLHYIK